jgi:general secretion pathway protein J
MTMATSRLPRGFTLVEVLVAMALLSLVMLGLLTAMRSFAQSETRIDERIRIDDDLRVSERFLRTVLSSVSPRTRSTPAGAPKEIDFAGGADDMRWIGVMPARHGAGGLYRFHLYARPATADDPTALMLEFVPYVPGFEAPLDPGAVQQRAMATAIGEVRFRYQDDLASGEQWLAEWPHADRLPRRIGLSVVNATHPWPEMIVAVLPVSGPMSVGRGGVGAGPMVGPL